jgi:hypothetical protein
MSGSRYAVDHRRDGYEPTNRDKKLYTGGKGDVHIHASSPELSIREQPSNPAPDIPRGARRTPRYERSMSLVEAREPLLDVPPVLVDRSGGEGHGGAARDRLRRAHVRRARARRAERAGLRGGGG